MDDVTRERIELLTKITDAEVRAREILIDAMEFLHAEIQQRSELTVRTRSMKPPYKIDGGEYADPQFVTKRLRFETTQIVHVTTIIAQYIGHGPEHLKAALLQCNQVLTKFLDKFEGWGGIVVRSAFLGKPEQAKAWIEAIRDLAGATAGELAALIAEAQKHDTDRPGAEKPSD